MSVAKLFSWSPDFQILLNLSSWVVHIHFKLYIFEICLFPLNLCCLFHGRFYFGKLCHSSLTQARKTCPLICNYGSVWSPVYHSPLSLYNLAILDFFYFLKFTKLYWLRHFAYGIFFIGSILLLFRKWLWNDDGEDRFQV